MGKGQERAYGAQSYWQQRYLDSGECSDRTDEWLLEWQQLEPLFDAALQPGDAVLDVGCGNSTLCFHLANAFGGRVVALDNAPAAISELSRIKESWRGLNAGHVELVVGDAMKLHKAVGSGFDAVVEKSTSDAILCDRARGAARVACMYRQISLAMKADAVCFIISYRQPDEGLEWLSECVLPALIEGAASPHCHYAVDIHIVDGPQGDEPPPPAVYEIRRRQRRVMDRPSKLRRMDNEPTVEFRYRSH
jgi:SAM-dependent methyltransferase|mmetsp:Transcript_9475/g.21383  ORF Transcript_9475/g.21383 Transcript_9475/m.21383 type:complete len:249 (-) Transcript_9475:158-904(-)